MKVDQRLIQKKACYEAIDWYLDQDTNDAETLLSKCDDLSWIAWYLEHANLITTGLTLRLVKLVLPIFESKFPDDDRPRKAIKATYIAHAAYAADADAAVDATNAAYAACAAADAYTDADAAADADAAYAAGAAAYAAYDAAHATAHAVHITAYATAHITYTAHATAHITYTAHAVSYAARAADAVYATDKTYIEKFKQIIREEVIKNVKDD